MQAYGVEKTKNNNRILKQATKKKCIIKQPEEVSGTLIGMAINKWDQRRTWIGFKTKPTRALGHSLPF